MRMSNFNSVSMVSAFAFCAVLPVVAQSSSRFADPQNGVTFRYPGDWKEASQNRFYLGQDFVSDKAEVRGVVAWKAWEQTENAKTTLAGTQFVYALDRNASSTTCLHPQNQGDPTASTVDTVKIGGIAYAHSHGEEGGMCHSEREDVYTAYRNHACYLFDLSVHTICPGVVDGMRDATPAELADAHTRLMEILKTVRIKPHQQNTIH
jgi:hypothetical protein